MCTIFYLEFPGVMPSSYKVKFEALRVVKTKMVKDEFPYLGVCEVGVSLLMIL